MLAPKGETSIFERLPLKKLLSRDRLVVFRRLGPGKCAGKLRGRIVLQTM
jgi:hypothetical protein